MFAANKIKMKPVKTYVKKKARIKREPRVKELCRLCLEEPGEEAVSPFSPNNAGVTWVMKIRNCLGLEIEEDENLPDLICLKCCNEINRSYEFKSKCETNYEKLKQYLLTFEVGDKYHMNIGAEVLLLNNDSLVVIDGENVEMHAEAIGVYHATYDESLMPNDADIKPGSADNGVELVTYCIEQQQPEADDEEETEQYIIPDDSNMNIESAENGVQLVTYCIKQEQNEHIEKEHESELQASELELEAVVCEESVLGSNQSADDEEEGVVSEEVVWLEEVPHHDTEDNEESQHELEQVEVKPLLEEGVPADGLMVFAEEDEAITLKFYDEKHKEMHKSPENEDHPNSESSEEKKQPGAACGVCGLRLSGRWALQRHMRVHSGERPFPCSQCPSRFSQLAILKRHELVHLEKRPFPCESCPLQFTQASGLKAHRLSHLAPDQRRTEPHRCTHCQKEFRHASGLSRHLKSHLGQQHQCVDCNLSFHDQSSLRRHFLSNKHKLTLQHRLFGHQATPFPPISPDWWKSATHKPDAPFSVPDST